MIKGIFYSKFDVHEGPKVVHQIPEYSVTARPGTSTKPLVAFPSISSFVIPRQTFCSIPLTVLHHPYRVLTHPVCLTNAAYPRNEFIFSFSIILHHKTQFCPYLPVVTKLATLFQHLEESSRFLSSDNAAAPNSGRIFALCEILLEDLNNYSEAMIPIDEANTLNIKLFPQYPPPPSLSPHQVPLAVINLDDLKDDNWDLTMLRILPFLNGVNSIRQIAHQADADYKLVRKAIAHLVYYGCVMLIDIFSFGACYAPTEQIRAFAVDREMHVEGRSYVLTAEARAAIHQVEQAPESKSAITSALLSGQTPASKELARMANELLDGSSFVELYLSLRQGQSLKNWCLEHAELVTSGVLDVRRFINFGVVKGFLYRVHRYAIAGSQVKSKDALAKKDSDAVYVFTNEIDHKRGIRGGDDALRKYLDGLHSFDEIMTELGLTEKELTGRLKELGDIQIIQK